jgi:predicted nucleotidyltransferase component of viral defense system
MAITPRAAVELFHLVFLRALVAKGEEKSLIALKGGCNLRFYFASNRYSEDIDFDVIVIRQDTLFKKVEGLLRSPLVTAPLKTRGITVTGSSAPKQTETTQRWKVGMLVSGASLPLRTKIEFSRRGHVIEGAAFEATAADLLRPHGLTPILATHYGTHAAIAQKIHALAARAEPQARDVFDASHLLARPDASGLRLTDRQKKWLPSAVERAMSVSYDEYVAKVIAYLEPSQAALFSARHTWDAMQSSVVSTLETLA